MASLLGYGHSRSISGATPFFGPATEAIIKKWTGLFKKYRHIFNGDFNSLLTPNGGDVEAVFWAAPESSEALLIVLNPRPTEVSVNLLLPLGHAEIVGPYQMQDAFGTAASHGTTDELGNHACAITLAGYAVKVYYCAPSH